MKVKLDARGLACPLPIIKTKQKLKEIDSKDHVETWVDNEIAVENLLKFAAVKGYYAKDQKIDEQTYAVMISKQKMDEPSISVECLKNDTVVVIAGKTMGQGDEVLGEKLMSAFLYALSQQDFLPSTLIFYNSGAYYPCQHGPVYEDLKMLESKGVKIMTCGTCLDYYGLTSSLKIGSISNMYEIVETLSQASKVIRP